MWYEPMFYACNYGVVPLWLLLVFAPRAEVTRLVVHSVAPALMLGACYAAILFSDRAGSPDGSFFTLDGIAAIFTSRQTVAAAWIHYLVFDLFVGAWEVRDAERVGIPHWAVVPCLVATLLVGPVGLLAYALMRGIWKRRWALTEEPAPPR